MKDLKSNISVDLALIPVAHTATKSDSSIIDLQGANSATVIINTGAIAGDGDYTITLRHGDASDLSNDAAVTDDELLGSLPASLAANTVYTVGYIGGKRYLRVVIDESDLVAARAQTSTPNLSALEFPAMELYAQPGATQTMLDDAAFNIEQWLADEVAIEFAEQEGEAFISGDGVGKPRGLLSYSMVDNSSYAWGKVGFVKTGVASDFHATSPGDNLIDLVYSLKRGYRQNGTFLMNDLTESKVRKFKASTSGEYLWQPSLAAGVPPTLLGYPIETDDNMPDVGSSKFPILFGDFRRAYLVVDRIGIRVLRDPFTAKPNVLFYTTKRVGGGIQNFEAVKALKVSA